MTSDNLPTFKYYSASLANIFSACFLIPRSCDEPNIPNSMSMCQFNWTTKVHRKHTNFHILLCMLFCLVRLGGPISTYLAMPRKLEFQTAEQTGFSCIKFMLLQNHGLCLTWNELFFLGSVFLKYLENLISVFLKHLENLICGWPGKHELFLIFVHVGFVIVVFQPLFFLIHSFFVPIIVS